ncbi:MAG: acyl-CoA/acyl-ACP dehydrogenase [Acidobacteria bacterium]|nr:acyl-CoA/acyl-ACP dehydrogenase [Acidobacteriota bacterium]
MLFGLTETQQLTRNAAREFFSAEYPIAEVRRIMETETAHDAALWRKTAGQGWCGMTIPEACGGMGLGLVEIAAAMEEAGRALVPGPLLAHLTACAAIAASGSMPAGLPGGEKIATFADSTKLFVMDAAIADYVVVQTPEGALLVDSFTVEPMPGIDLTRRLYKIHFESGEPLDAGFDRALAIGTTLLCAEMTGAMQKMLDLTVGYCKTRKQFGKAIGAYQLVQAMCADMLVATESARSATYYAAYALQENLPEALTAVSVAKSFINEAARQTGNNAIQCHGGMGFTWENDIHLYYRRAKAAETAFGDTAWHRERIAQFVL